MLNEYSFGDIYIRRAIDQHPNDKDFEMHIHEQCEIYFFISGRVDYLVEGSKYPLEEHSLMIMRPCESHKAKIVESRCYERYALNFPLSFATSVDPQNMLMKPFCHRPLGKNNLFTSDQLDMALIHKLFYEMCIAGDDYTRRLTITIHLLTLLEQIYRAFSKNTAVSNPPQSFAERMVLYVNQHLFDDLSVPILAKHFYLSPSQFSRVFKQATGAAPWTYIMKKRLTAAKEKIRSGCSAQKACKDCGFNDYSVFYRAYTKHFGCAPADDLGHFRLH